MGTLDDIRTDFLLPKRSLFTGFSSVFNIAGNAEFNTSKTGEEADCKAIRSDWEMIGQDIRQAINTIVDNE